MSDRTEEGEIDVMHKRSKGTGLGIALMLVALAVSMSMSAHAGAGSIPSVYGADANPTGDPIGGGVGYRRLVLQGDYLVSTADELLDAMRQVQAGEVIMVASQAEIDMTGYSKLEIKPGVTLAGDRGYEGSTGPLIYTDEFNTYPLFYAGEGVRITGLRLRGPDPDTQESAYVLPNSCAIDTRAPGLEVDNNEIFNWSYAGVSVRHGPAHVHHNVIHHVRRAGLGYPVVVNQGTALIEANYFDWYRHAIASTGMLTAGYEARYNWVGPNATSFAFDMHGGADFCPKRATPCSTQEKFMGGEWIKIHHNTFEITHQRAIGIRGVPLQGGDIYRNWFAHTDPNAAVGFRNYLGNVSVRDNAYGPAQAVVDRFVDASPFVRTCSGWCSVTNPNLPVVNVVAPIKIGFVQPSPEAGSIVTGQVPVEVQVETAGFFELERLEIRLDDQPLFVDRRVPQAGELVLDTYELVDGSHDLSFTVTGTQGVKLREEFRLHVANWWQKQDPLNPPVENAWFGTIDRSMTSDRSSGWVYATDDVASPFDDDGRLVRREHTAEYLEWEAPCWRESVVTLYVQGSLGENWVSLSTSVDGETWASIPCEVSSAERVGEWTRYVLKSTPAVIPEADFFRLDISENAPVAGLQLGEVHLRGWK